MKSQKCCEKHNKIIEYVDVGSKRCLQNTINYFESMIFVKFNLHRHKKFDQYKPEKKLFTITLFYTTH